VGGKFTYRIQRDAMGGFEPVLLDRVETALRITISAKARNQDKQGLG